MEWLRKRVIRVGNSAGVLLPREWSNGIVEARLVEPPLNYDKLADQVIGIIKEKLHDVKALAICGSYSRGEQTLDSDVDILAITNRINDHLKIGRYDILLVSEEKIREELEKNAFPILPMLKEAKPIINNKLIEEYAGKEINEKNIAWHIETTKKMMKEAEEDIKFSEKRKENVSMASAYSLILRLRSLYIIECLKNRKIWKKTEFLRIIRRISGSLNVYEEYLKVKNKKTGKPVLKVEEAKKLRSYILKKNEEIEKWVRGKRD